MYLCICIRFILVYVLRSNMFESCLIYTSHVFMLQLIVNMCGYKFFMWDLFKGNYNNLSVVILFLRYKDLLVIICLDTITEPAKNNSYEDLLLCGSNECDLFKIYRQFMHVWLGTTMKQMWSVILFLYFLLRGAYMICLRPTTGCSFYFFKFYSNISIFFSFVSCF